MFKSKDSKEKTFENTMTAMTVISAATPIALFVYHLGQNHRAKKRRSMKPKRWMRGTFQSPFSSALTLDLIFSYLVFLSFAHRETRSGRVKDPFWVYALISTCIGVSPAFPLLLLRRKNQKE